LWIYGKYIVFWGKIKKLKWEPINEITFFSHGGIEKQTFLVTWQNRNAFLHLSLFSANVRILSIYSLPFDFSWSLALPDLSMFQYCSMKLSRQCKNKKSKSDILWIAPEVSSLKYLGQKVSRHLSFRSTIDLHLLFSFKCEHTPLNQ
jgi:hypothetical protein